MEVQFQSKPFLLSFWIIEQEWWGMSLWSSVRLLVKLVLGRSCWPGNSTHRKVLHYDTGLLSENKKTARWGRHGKQHCSNPRSWGETYSGTVIKVNISLCLLEKQNFYFSILSWGIKLRFLWEKIWSCTTVIEKSVWKQYIDFGMHLFKLGDLKMHKQIPSVSFLLHRGSTSLKWSRILDGCRLKGLGYAVGRGTYECKAWLQHNCFCSFVQRKIHTKLNYLTNTYFYTAELNYCLVYSCILTRNMIKTQWTIAKRIRTTLLVTSALSRYHILALSAHSQYHKSETINTIISLITH